MASIIARNGGFQAKWRAGRQGDWQSCTFADDKQAGQAAELAKAHRHRISDFDVYKIVLGISGDDPPRVPTFEAWAMEWVSNKKGVQPDVLAATGSMNCPTTSRSPTG